MLVGGFIKGIWEYKAQHAITTITIDLFSSINHGAKEKLAAEAERLGKFLNTPVHLAFIES